MSGDNPPHDDEPTPSEPRRRRASDRARATAAERPESGGASSAEPSSATTRTNAVPPPRRPCLLVLAGPRLGELVPIDGELVIGRDAAAGLQILDDGVSRRHARVIVESDEARLLDLDSANGTWIDEARVGSRPLRDGERFRVGQTTVVKFAWLDADEERRQRELLDRALRDTLTPAFNARYFGERLEAEVAYAERHATPLAVLLAGVDRFALVNRIHGRDAGDDLLRRLAEVLEGAIRADDVLARLEGDTFALLAQDTGPEGGSRLADRLRGVVADARFEVGGQPVELRLSIGVAAVAPASPRTAAALLEAAHRALARAKRLGRNRFALDEHGPRDQS